MNDGAQRVLAVHEDSNSCAALFVDGRLEYAAAEERFSRVRFHAGRPERTLRSIRQRYGIGDQDHLAVVVANLFSFLPSLPLPLLPQEEHDMFSISHKAYLLYQEALWRSSRTRAVVERMNRALLRRRFPTMVHLGDHHTAHAYSAYMTSGFAAATAITADGFGDGSSGKVFRCEAGRCRELYGGSAVSSVGIFHAEIAQLLGIDARLGGKVTGMAAYGDPGRAYPLVERLIAPLPGNRAFALPSIRARRRDRFPYTELACLPKQDVAAAVQQRLEDVFIPYVETALAESGINDVVLAGGVFGNVKLTQRIVELPSVGRVFVHPAMNDHGIAVGAGLEYLARAHGARPARLANVFLGPDFSDEECARALDDFGLRYREEADIDARVASLLADGEIVARFSGRMEYGPRALGNRSILYRSDDASVNNWLNRMLRRKEYMPFAPATLAEAAAECYGEVSRIRECVRFMTVAVPCTEYMRRTSPAAVHIDGTARPQVVWEEDNPSYYRMLRLYRERTGIPSVINTSFNMHEEPIVCDPRDACRAFLSARLPYMAMNRFLVSAPDGNERPG
jgi:carbamoyltransferase